MADDYTGIVLWDEDDNDHLEDTLPLAADLRKRVKDWLRDWEENMGIDTTIGDDLKHDRAGYELSLDLQAALGSDYEIVYVFETRQLRQEIRQRERRKA